MRSRPFDGSADHRHLILISHQGYLDFLDEVMSSISVRWPDAITMFEAFSSDNAFKLLNRYRTQHCALNDDINSTASVVLASLMSSCRIKGSKLADETMLLYGAGNSGCGIATLIVQQLVADGLSETDARSKIWMVCCFSRPFLHLDSVDFARACSHTDCVDADGFPRAARIVSCRYCRCRTPKTAVCAPHRSR